MHRIFFSCLCALASYPAEAAIVFGSDGGYSHSGTSPAAITAPAGTALNDLLVMCANVATNTAQGTLTTPAGWTLGGSTGAALDGGTNFVNTYLFYKVAVAGDVGASSYSVAYNTGGTLVDIAADVRNYTGTVTASPLDSSAFILTSASSQTSVVPALSTFTSGEVYVGCDATDINLTVSTATPTLSHVFNPAPFIIRIYMGDYLPSGTPGTETYDYGAGNVAQGRTGWGATFKAVGGGGGGGPSSLPLIGVGH